MSKPTVHPAQSIANAINAGHTPMARAVDRLSSGAASQHKDGARAGLRQQQQAIDYAHAELAHHVQQARAGLPADHPAQRELALAVQAGDDVKATADHYCDDGAVRRVGSHLQVAQQLVAAHPAQLAAPPTEAKAVRRLRKETHKALKQYRAAKRTRAAEQEELQKRADWNAWIASVKRRRLV